jgi:diacylglycerol kinase (ATP)
MASMPEAASGPGSAVPSGDAPGADDAGVARQASGAVLRSKAEHLAEIRRRRRMALVVNTRSRQGLRLYRTACGLLEASGFDLLGLFPAGRPDELYAGLAAAVDMRPDLLVVGGGDGTLSLAARYLAFQDIALGVLPLGTTNNFARSLGIPLTVTAAVEVLTGGKVADVDLGEAGGVYFTNLVSVGLSGHVADTVPHSLKRVLGSVAYPLAALAGLPGHRPFRAVVRAGEERRVVTTHQLNIANGSFHAGRPITADASADDRLLVAYSLGDASRGTLVGAIIRHVLSGARRSYTEPAFLVSGQMHLSTDPPLPLVIDGEVHGRTPVGITMAANALRVMVPADFPDA